jgi:acyl-CoA thioester hydrolase
VSDKTVLRPLLLEMDLKILGYDIDVMGIVSNIVYVRWFEDLRFYFLENYYPFEEMFKDQQSPILATTEVNYKFPLTIYDKPVGRIWVSHLGRAKWEVSFEIQAAKKIHCLGKQIGYFINMERRKPIAVPKRLVDHYKAATAND